MTRILTIAIFLMSLLACTNKAVQKDKEAVVENTLEDEYETKRDSLGYPEYYVHPSIREIKDLEKLLRKADKVLGYNFNDNNGNSANVECDHLYGQNDKLCKSAINEKILSTNQINKLVRITCDTSTYTGEWNGIHGVCYIPHLGFGFFQKDSLLAEVSVCFICQGIRTVPYYKSDGLSSKGAKAFADLAKELDLKIIDGSTKMSY